MIWGGGRCEKTETLETYEQEELKTFRSTNNKFVGGSYKKESSLKNIFGAEFTHHHKEVELRVEQEAYNETNQTN